jgi:hypothetical protein
MATRSVTKRAQFQDLFQNVIVYSDNAFDPGNAATGSGTFASSDVTVTGAALGDVVLASFTVDTVDTAIVAAVTAANTVTVTVLNNTAGAVNLAAGTLTLYVLQRNTQLTV